jgi:hypothetical protein
MAFLQFKNDQGLLWTSSCGRGRLPAPARVSNFLSSHLKRKRDHPAWIHHLLASRTGSTYIASDTQQETLLQKQQPSSCRFEWYKSWYPVAVLEDLDPDVPQPVSLLGMNLVVWRDRDCVWR